MCLSALFDEQEMPESRLDYSGDSTGIIKPEALGGAMIACSWVSDFLILKVPLL